jgi:glycosyltransferase involved in cell wall biosynthesis
MTTSPIFSVIIPTYNSTSFIERTVESVLNQTFSDFELIIIDDGSKDSTSNVLKNLAEKDTRIKIITTPNSGGPVVPTNIGITVAKGKYIAFLDHDDEWRPNKLEAVRNAFLYNPHAGFVASNVEIYNEADGTTTISNAPVRNQHVSVPDMIAGKYFNTFSMLVIQKDVLNRVGSLDKNLSVFADYDIVVRMLTSGIVHIFLPDPLVIYRVHENNTSSIAKSAEKRIADLERITTKYQKKYNHHRKSLSLIHHAIGRIYLNIGNRKGAIEHFKKSLLCDLSNPAAYVRLLSSYFGEKPYRVMRKIYATLGM